MNDNSICFLVLSPALFVYLLSMNLLPTTPTSAPVFLEMSSCWKAMFVQSQETLVTRNSFPIVDAHSCVSFSSFGKLRPLTSLYVLLFVPKDCF